MNRINEQQGWFFEIEGEIPLKIRNSVKDFVFLCISRPVPWESQSFYNICLVEDGSMLWTPPNKSYCQPHPEKNIVVHHVLLRWMLDNDLKVIKIQSVLQFDQKPSMKAFINSFISKRSKAKTKVEK